MRTSVCLTNCTERMSSSLEKTSLLIVKYHISLQRLGQQSSPMLGAFYFLGLFSLGLIKEKSLEASKVAQKVEELACRSTI